MELSQLIYTACKTGIMRSGNGFQIFSYSEDMPSCYYSIEGIGKMCKYKSPNNLPFAPTVAEIENLFPVNYSYNKIDDCHYFISQNRYVGLDNTGKRFGNFISHCVAVENIDVYPALSLGSKTFLSDLPVEKKNMDEAPAYLPKLRADDIFSGELSFDEVSNYFMEDSSRIFYLRAMVKATFDCLKTGKRIVICDDARNIPYWIAGTTYAFPLYIARGITFSTYAYDPLEADCMICGVFSAGTAYSPQATRDSGIFHIFDFVNNVFSYDDGGGGYFDVVESGYSLSKSVLDNLHSFLSEMKYLPGNGYLPAMYSTYQLYNGNAQALEISSVREAAAFIVSSADIEFGEKFFMKVLSLLDNDDDLSMDYAYVCIKFAFLQSERNPNSNLKLYASYVYWMKILSLVNDCVLVGKERIENFEANILDINAGVKKQIAESMFSEKVVSEVAVSMQSDSVEYHNVFWGQRILSYISESGLTLESFAQKCNSNILKEIYLNIQLVEKPVECAESIVKFVPTRLKYNFFRSLIPLFSNKSDVKIGLESKALQLLISEKEVALLTEFMETMTDAVEFQMKTEAIKNIISLTINDRDAFYRLCNVLMREAAYWNTCQGIVIQYYCDMVSSKENRKEELYRLACFVLDTANDSHAINLVVQAYDKELSLSEKTPKEMEQVSVFIQKLKDRNINCESTKACLIWILNKKVWEKRIKDVSSLDLLYQCNWAKLNDNEFATVVSRLFRQCVPSLNTISAHKSFAKIFSDVEGHFWGCYCGEVLNIVDKEPEIAASLFEYSVSETVDEVNEILLDAFAAMSKKQFQNVSEKIYSCVSKNYKKRFSEFLADVEKEQEKKKSGLINKIKKAFGRKDT